MDYGKLLYSVQVFFQTRMAYIFDESDHRNIVLFKEAYLPIRCHRKSNYKGDFHLGEILLNGARLPCHVLLPPSQRGTSLVTSCLPLEGTLLLHKRIYSYRKNYISSKSLLLAKMKMPKCESESIHLERQESSIPGY